MGLKTGRNYHLICLEAIFHPDREIASRKLREASKAVAVRAHRSLEQECLGTYIWWVRRILVRISPKEFPICSNYFLHTFERE